MRPMARAASALAFTLAAGKAAAQSPCTEETRFDPPLRVLRCSDGLVLETEQGSGLRPIDRDGDGHLEGAEIGGRSVLVTLPPGPRVRREGFQILTPHAIASVRGTVYAVDVTTGRTSVFVQQGRVVVARRRGADDAVTLGPGEGVDVDMDRSPLAVRRWPQERVRALLERFGR
ncbi:FecR domain-containing protein [Methylobacterium sp. SyP6R]|uniref:FecR domain-containing protein n=1 Tax=Methylobacterium sp. SyP6R TaxID=2718876 RepID=UPI001F3F41B3|nr:FecR domain-containing protein [Methylobacterium sp. SyP6R]MCF4129903.1 FecR family protein [Methylobacterium sp. SyP6R]